MANSREELAEWFDENDGVASVAEVATLLDVDENAVRRFARENDVRRIGATFVFGLPAVEELAEALDGEDDVFEDEDESEDDFEDDDSQ